MPNISTFAMRIRHGKSPQNTGGGFFTYSWSFFAYSPLRPLLDALSHCKQKAPTVSKKAKIVSKKAKNVNRK